MVKNLPLSLTDKAKLVFLLFQSVCNITIFVPSRDLKDLQDLK